MGLNAATVVNFDGHRTFSKPADGVTFVPDARGAYHFPKLKQGSTMEFDIDFRDNDGNLVVLTSLASVVYRASWRANYTDTNPEITATFTNPTTTTLRVRVAATATAALGSDADDEQMWDLEIQYDDGGLEPHVDQRLRGKYRFEMEATK